MRSTRPMTYGRTEACLVGITLSKLYLAICQLFLAISDPLLLTSRLRQPSDPSIRGGAEVNAKLVVECGNGVGGDRLVCGHGEGLRRGGKIVSRSDWVVAGERGFEGSEIGLVDGKLADPRMRRCMRQSGNRGMPGVETAEGRSSGAAAALRG